MERTNMSKEAKTPENHTCPACGGPLGKKPFRGVCRLCFWAWKKRPDGERGNKAAPFIKPTRGQAAAANRPAGDVDEGELPQMAKMDRAESASRQEADCRLAMATELATALGLGRVPFCGGFLLTHPVNGKAVFLSESGRLRPADVRIGVAPG
jgi:hypothetical protein